MKRHIAITALLPAFVAAAVSAVFGQNDFGEPDAVDAWRDASEFFNAYSRSTRSKDSIIPPFVVQFSGTDGSGVAQMEEDLAVMTRIVEKSLEKGLGNEEPPSKMGIRMFLTGGSRSVRAMYLDGFGVLFMVKVNFPVLAPPKVEAKKLEPAVTTEWETAWKELYDQPESAGQTGSSRSTGAEYNATQVEALKKVLLQSLKHAANLRRLKPDEFIGVSVFGSEAVGVAQTSESKSNASSRDEKKRKGQPAVVENTPEAPPAVAPGKGGNSAGGAGIAQGNSRQNTRTGAAATPTPASEPPLTVDAARATTRSALDARRAGRGTVLTVRVKKSDVDAFAKDQLDFDSFQKTATVSGYTGSGHGVLSLNSWLSTGSSTVRR